MTIQSSVNQERIVVGAFVRQNKAVHWLQADIQDLEFVARYLEIFQAA